jgi:predicted transglutaminase-like cysteine proteinase
MVEGVSSVSKVGFSITDMSDLYADKFGTLAANSLKSTQVTTLNKPTDIKSLTANSNINLNGADINESAYQSPVLSYTSAYEAASMNSFAMLMDMMNNSNPNSMIYTPKFKPIYDPEYSVLFTTEESLALFNAYFNIKPPGQENYLKQIYTEYLDTNDSKFRALAAEITKGDPTQDSKMQDLLNYVITNVQYQLDIENYGTDEYWAMPEMTDAKKTGDCEDGAFYLASLALNAKIEPERIRVYGGLVSDGEGGAAGHAWVAYKRETDNQWVTMDWCYYANDVAVRDRPLMKDDPNLFYPFFYVTSKGTLVSDGINDTIHNPNWPNSGTRMQNIKYYQPQNQAEYYMQPATGNLVSKEI